MDTKNKLAIFKKSVRGLLKQKEQSICDGDCVYIGPEGHRCAIGMLITKKAYDPLMENNGPASDRVKKVLKKCGIIVSTKSDSDFLAGLQEIHDSNEPYEWIDLFVEFARVEFSMSEKDSTKLVKSLKPTKKIRK